MTSVNLERLLLTLRASRQTEDEPDEHMRAWHKGYNAGIDVAIQTVEAEAEVARYMAEKARRIERLAALADVEPREWTPSIDADYR